MCEIKKNEEKKKKMRRLERKTSGAREFNNVKRKCVRIRVGDAGGTSNGISQDWSRGFYRTRTPRE